MEPGAWGLIGVVIGGVLTTIATFTLEGIRERRLAESLAAAFRGEILALRTIVKKRDYVRHLQNIVKHIEESGRGFSDWGVRIEHEYFNIFRANVDKIGKLRAPLPEYIASFYVAATAIVEDFKGLSAGVLADADIENQLRFYRELIVLMQENAEDADKIVATISKLYPDIEEKGIAGIIG